MKMPYRGRRPTEEDVGQRRVAFHVRHPVVHYDHDEGRDPGHHQQVQHGQHRLEALRLQRGGVTQQRTLSATGKPQG